MTISRTEGLDRASTADIRWRFEQGLRELDAGRLNHALEYAVEAGEVLSAVLERQRRERATASTRKDQR